MYFTTATLHWNASFLISSRFSHKTTSKVVFSSREKVLTDAEIAQFCWRKLLLSVPSCADWASISYISREDLKISRREAGEGERGGKNGWKGCGRIINGRG